MEIRERLLTLKLIVEFVGKHIEKYIPEYAKQGDAGFDLRADIKDGILLEPGETVTFGTGMKFQIEEGYEIQIRSRSGLAAKNKVVILNSPGTIDANYRGEVGAIMTNHGREPFLIEPNMRVCQAVVNKIETVSLREGVVPNNTDRGAGGYGSTGLK